MPRCCGDEILCTVNAVDGLDYSDCGIGKRHLMRAAILHSLASDRSFTAPTSALRQLRHSVVPYESKLCQRAGKKGRKRPLSIRTASARRGRRASPLLPRPEQLLDSSVGSRINSRRLHLCKESHQFGNRPNFDLLHGLD
jgi:hypothetical protein